jgi:hypothetical protein
MLSMWSLYLMLSDHYLFVDDYIIHKHVDYLFT